MATYTTHTGAAFDRTPFEALVRRRLFFTASFEIYRTSSSFVGDTPGLYDYGLPGCALQAYIVDLWRKYFVLEENMLEVDCTFLTSEDVFKTSVHVDKFSDWICKDTKKGDYLRADHLIENVLESRLAEDKSARGITVSAEKEDVDPKKKRRAVKDIKAIKLGDATTKEYEEILARVRYF
jgi:glycyl-tRNA synthetase